MHEGCVLRQVFVQEKAGTWWLRCVVLFLALRSSWSFAYASGSSNIRNVVLEIAGGLVAAEVGVAMMNPVCLKHV